jgi:hypothetical protein
MRCDRTLISVGLGRFPAMFTTFSLPTPTLAFATVCSACIQAGTASAPSSIPVVGTVLSPSTFSSVASDQFSLRLGVGGSAAFTATAQIAVAVRGSVPRVVGILKAPSSSRGLLCLWHTLRLLRAAPERSRWRWHGESLVEREGSRGPVIEHVFEDGSMEEVRKPDWWVYPTHCQDGHL